MFRRCLFCLLLLFVGVKSGLAQSDDVLWGEMLELWAEQNDSESIPDDLVEQLQDMCENPVNLNDTSAGSLMSIPFLSDFQRKALCAYILQNGQMVSMNELFFINGFDTLTIRMLKQVAKCELTKQETNNIGQLLKKGHSNFVAGTKTAFPQGRGYQEDIYLGSPFRYYFRYRFNSGDRISFQVSGDKDAGEAFVFGRNGDKKQYGFDYYGYHLMLNDFGRMKRVIVGKYQLQFGQGATLWSGFAPWMSEAMPLRRYGTGIRPASAFCEYGFLRGVATTVSLLPQGRDDDLELTLFYSNVDRDATAADSDSIPDSERQYRSIYQSGYHRTANELEKKGNLNEQLYGGNLQYRNRRLTIGATTYTTKFSNEITPAEYVYNHFAFRGKDNFNLGVDATYGYRNLLFFGEAAMSLNNVSYAESGNDWLPVASVAGMQVHFNSDNMLSVAYRYGSPTYHNLHADLIGQGSTVANEESFAVFFKSRLPLYVHLVTSVFFSRYPTLRYNVYGPSTGADYRLRLSKEIARNTLLDLRFRYKQSQRNQASQTYVIETVRRQQLQLSLDYNPSQQWRFLSRVAYSWFNGDESNDARGFLVFQEVSWNKDVFSRPMVLGLRLSMFDVDNYDARIYSYERDLQYEYGVPMMIGRGLRGFVVFRYAITPRLTMSLKYTLSYYPDQETIGSGYEKIEENRKQEIKAQIRLHF